MLFKAISEKLKANKAKDSLFLIIPVLLALAFYIADPLKQQPGIPVGSVAGVTSSESLTPAFNCDGSDPYLGWTEHTLEYHGITLKTPAEYTVKEVPQKLLKENFSLLEADLPYSDFAIYNGDRLILTGYLKVMDFNGASCLNALAIDPYNNPPCPEVFSKRTETDTYRLVVDAANVSPARQLMQFPLFPGSSKLMPPELDELSLNTYIRMSNYDLRGTPLFESFTEEEFQNAVAILESIQPY